MVWQQSWSIWVLRVFSLFGVMASYFGGKGCSNATVFEKGMKNFTATFNISTTSLNLLKQ